MTDVVAMRRSGMPFKAISKELGMSERLIRDTCLVAMGQAEYELLNKTTRHAAAVRARTARTNRHLDQRNATDQEMTPDILTMRRNLAIIKEISFATGVRASECSRIIKQHIPRDERDRIDLAIRQGDRRVVYSVGEFNKLTDTLLRRPWGINEQ